MVRAEVTREPSGAVFARNFLDSARSVFVRLRPAIAVATVAAMILIVLTVAWFMPQRGIGTTDEIVTLTMLDEGSNGTDYDLGTPAENYFL